MRKTIKKHKDFECDDTANVVATDLFIVKSRATLFPGDARYGLIVTKRTFRHAVNRNRAKRLLRAWIRQSEDGLDDRLDYIFIARAKILGADLPTGLAVMKKALRKISK